MLPDRAAADAWQLLRVALSAAEEQLRGKQLEDWIRCYLDVNYGQGPEWTDDNTITAVVQRLNGLARTWRDATDTRIARARNHSIRDNLTPDSTVDHLANHLPRGLLGAAAANASPQQQPQSNNT